MRICTVVAACAMLSCSTVYTTEQGQPPPSISKTPAPPSPQPGRQPVEVEMRNVDLRVTAEITLHVAHLRGRFVPVARASMPYLDDKESYTVTIDSAEIAMGMASLNALMKRRLADARSNVEKVRISTGAQQGLRQEGVLDKGINVPFNTEGGVGVTSDGRIIVRTSNVHGFGLPMTPVMKMFGIEMDDLLKVEPGHGITVRGNDLILDPQQLIPPPVIHGKITAVRVAGNALIQTFGSGERRSLSPPAVSKNFIYWRGGDLQFGKLTMAATDLELVDEDPGDPFDFSIDHWNDQLVAGYSKNTPSRGLKAHMPDYNDLPHAPRR